MSFTHAAPASRLPGPCLAAAALLFVSAASPALADENGSSVYLLGSGGPGAAVLPPLPGVYIDNTIYIYSGGSSSDRDFVIGGNVVADVHADIAANFTTLLWVPTTNFMGGTLAIGATLPVAAPMINARGVITGPLGRQLDVRREDSTLAVGDPLAMAELGWKSGNYHFTLSGLANIPVGHYREGELANIAFHRWAYDISAASSLHDTESGWDLSAKVGLTFNGRNKATDYDSGNDFHAEAAIEKTVSPVFSIGAQGYYLQQVTGDSGSGARLGAYKGRVFGLGGTMAFNTMMGRSPANFRIRVLQEFGSENRMEGTGVFLDLSLPLSMKMPKQ
jgi:hypothetical protein